MSIWRFADFYDPILPQHQISLGEGQTPVIRSRRLGPQAGLEHLFFKLETVNPTGSFKDRFAAAAVSHMLAAGQTGCVATSSGNTGAALAAYCAAAGIACEIAVVETAPQSKLHQMMAYGANIYRVRGFGVDADLTREAFEFLEEKGRKPQKALQISAFRYSPLGMAGVRSISHELVEQCEGPIDHVFCPAGGGGLVVAVAQGFQQLIAAGRIAKSPHVECVQPEGNNTIAGPLREGSPNAQNVSCTSQISGLQVATVVDGDETIHACRACGGNGHLLADQQVWDIQRRLANEEGIFAEPAGAIATAAALEAARRGEISRDAVVACLVTGIGFKDPVSLEKMAAERSCPVIDAKDVMHQ